MESRLLNPGKALRTLRKTPRILAAALAGLTQQQAETLRDGPDGWNILFVVCHMRDYERIAIERVQTMLAADNPMMRATSNDEMIKANRYAEQDLAAVLAELNASRSAFIAQLEGLTDDQWIRPGVHPKQGAATVLDVAINTVLHDIDHIDQILSCRQS